MADKITFWDKIETGAVKIIIGIISACVVGLFLFYVFVCRTIDVHGTILKSHDQQLNNHEARIVKNREVRETQLDSFAGKIDDLKDEIWLMKIDIIKAIKKEDGK